MLRLRPIKREDLDELHDIHERGYPDLEIPKWHELLGAYVIEDENKKIVMGGGVAPIAEAFITTNKKASRIKIGRALVLAQNMSEYICRFRGVQELYAFTDDENYIKHLIQHGFKKREEVALYMRIE